MEAGVTPQSAKSAVELGSALTTAANWYFTLVIFQAVCLLIGLISNHFANNGACSFKNHRLTTRFRFISSLLVCMSCVACVWSIAVNEISDDIAYL